MKSTINIPVQEEFIKVVSDITYSQVSDYFGELIKNLKLDLLIPLDPEKKLSPRPLIIWIIGGAWMAVNKSKFNVEMSPFAKAGYAVASLEYRVSGEAIFPAQIIDVKSAIRYLRANANRYNLDPDRFYVMGESAGGHLAALAATADNMPEWEVGSYTDVSSRVQGCIDLYGVIDFLHQPLNPVPEMFHDLKSEDLLIGGSIEDHKKEAVALNPVNYAGKNTPPFLIFHGTNDPVVPYRQSEILYEGLTAKGVKADLYLVEDAAHADSKFYQKEIRDIIFRFLDKLS